MDSHTQKRWNWLILCILAAGTFALFAPALKFGFLNYDDPDYVTKNAHVQSGLGLDNFVWAFTKSYSANWHPLTWISHMLDCQLFGPRAWGHHLTNILFHVANTLLLFLTLRRMTGAIWRSALVAALFAWHPLHVESVAWISERKDVLSTFFWLLTMLAYLEYARRPGRKWYLLTLTGLALGLMSKPMVVTLPFVLLLLDFWPLNRFSNLPWQPSSSTTLTPDPLKLPKLPWTRLLIEKIPLFGLVILASLATFFAQKSIGAVMGLGTVPLHDRIANIPISYVRYLKKIIWPNDLAIFYPFQSWSNLQIAAALLFLFASLVLIVLSCRKWPVLAVGWLWFLGTLVPVIGIIQVGTQSMADRYSYIPAIGIFIILAWGLGELAARWRLSPRLLASASTIALIACIAATASTLQTWQNTGTLFGHALEVTSNNTVAYTSLGFFQIDCGKTNEAKTNFDAALKIVPNWPAALFGEGLLYSTMGDDLTATNYYAQALKSAPSAYRVINICFANSLYRLGKLPEAADHYTAALNADPADVEANYMLGSILTKLDFNKEAIEYLNTSLQFQPESASAHDQIAQAYSKVGNNNAAFRHYKEAVRIDPNLAHAQRQLGILMAQNGQVTESLKHFEKSAQLEPTNSTAHFALAAAYEMQGQLDKSVEEFSTTSRLDPRNYEARRRLANTLAKQRKFGPAIQAYRDSLAVNPDLPETLANLAWLLATCPQPELHNGAEAVQFAKKACALGDKKDLRLLTSLDAAYARAGQFDDAIKTARQVMEQATAENQKSLADAAAKRIELYKAGNAYQQ
jgi:protein O-mannosyl-transferase